MQTPEGTRNLNIMQTKSSKATKVPMLDESLSIDMHRCPHEGMHALGRKVLFVSAIACLVYSCVLAAGLLQGVRMTGAARGSVGGILGWTCCDREAGMGLPMLLCGVP